LLRPKFPLVKTFPDMHMLPHQTRITKGGKEESELDATITVY